MDPLPCRRPAKKAPAARGRPTDGVNPTERRDNMKLQSEKRQRTVVIVLFLLCPLALLLAFSYYPAAKLVELSFTDWNGMSKTYEYIGLANYAAIFRSQNAVKTLVNNLAYVIITVIQVVLGLYFAIILDSNVKAKRFFRSFLFMPYILNGVALANMFNYMYNFDDGPLNILIRAITGNPEAGIHYLGNTWASNMWLAGMGLWQYTGMAMVIFLGALQSIPKELYEAAEIDGGNFGQSVRYITIPSIRMVIELNLFLSLNGALQAFNQAYLITKGGPGDRTKTFALNAYYTAFDFHDFGIASALGVFLLALITVVMLVQNLVLKSGGDLE